jgi:hypothetical protein
LPIKSTIFCHLAILGLALPSTASAQELPDWFVFQSTTPKVIWLKPLKIEPDELVLNQLLKKRYNAALEELGARYSEFLAERGTVEFLYDAANRLRKSRLELARDRSERLVIMQDHIEWTKAMEAIMKGRFEAGKLPAKMYHEASYRRMQAEIDMLRLVDPK